MKALVMYLPQYYEVKENNEWWGNGYTEWTAVKSASTFSKRHVQPRIPLNNNYYSLSDPCAKTWKWQAEIAEQYNIYGFVIYHYWFKTGKQLLERPMEILLQHKEINTRYCICWANESWTRTWYGVESETLMLQEYRDKQEWINHFNYLLPFFKDDRYIKLDGKPLINIYHTFEIDCLKEMLEEWNCLAINNGFDGLCIVSGNTGAQIDEREELFDAYYNFEPSYSLIHKASRLARMKYVSSVFLRTMHNKVFSKKIVERPIDGKRFISRMEIKDPIRNIPIFPGAFPQWDNTPRRKYKATIFYNMDKECFRVQLKHAIRQYPDSEFVYVNAWNEWGEGAYLEPDETNQYAFLEVLKDEIKTFSES